MQLSLHAISSICSLSLFCTEHTWREPIDFIAPTKTWYKCFSIGTSAGWILLLINKLSLRKHWTGHYLSFNHYFFPLIQKGEKKKKKRRERKKLQKDLFIKTNKSFFLFKKQKSSPEMTDEPSLLPSISLCSRNFLFKFTQEIFFLFFLEFKIFIQHEFFVLIFINSRKIYTVFIAA